MQMPGKFAAAGDAWFLGSRVHVDLLIPKSCPFSRSGADTRRSRTSPGQVPLQRDELPVLPSTLLGNAAQGETCGEMLTFPSLRLLFSLIFPLWNCKNQTEDASLMTQQAVHS